MTRSETVAVIGAGFAGIVTAVKLRRAGVDVVVFERSDGVGGTWWENRYPGAETDAASHLYSYSFAPYRWSRTHVRQAEIQAYLEHVAEAFGIRPLVRFKEGVTAVEWDDASAEYVVETGSGARERFGFVVSAVGIFGEPRLPDWPGLESFAGPVVHTAAWDPATDWVGKRVAVVGTGSSAVQVVAALAPEAGHLTVFQRQPGWVLPKRDRDYTAVERRVFERRWAQRLDRIRLYLRQERREWRGALFRPGTRHHRWGEAVCRRFIAEIFAERPDLAAAVTPDYPFAGKRPVVSSDFYPALLRENVTLVPRAVSRCTTDGVVDADGVEHPADVLVLATGFEASRYLASLEVRGPGGLDLHRVWGDDPYALLGLMLPGFPNFFVMYGPNTNGGLIVSNLEHQADFVVHQVTRVRRRRATSVEARDAVVRRYDDWVQHRLAGTAWARGRNYYTSASGRIVTQWPEGAAVYAALTVLLRRVGTRVR